jgi:hypothetical protein
MGKARVSPLAFFLGDSLILLLALFPFSPSALGAEGILTLPPPSARPLFRLVHTAADSSVLRLEEATLDRLTHRSREGDVFFINLPDADVELQLEYASLDPKRDLDCCSVTLKSDRGEAVIPLTRSLSPRDFTLTWNGRKYVFKSTGNGLYDVR